MKVVIVAKTRQGQGACIGAISFAGQSVRLIAADAEWNETVGLEYEVGDVWELAHRPPAAVTPPHVENVVVTEKQRRPPLDDPIAFIERHMPPHRGDTSVLYEGLAQATSAGVLYIAERTGVPPFSTTFWRPDQPLLRDDDAKRIRYRYPGADGGRTLTFVGFQEPPAVIEAGTLLRVSLAHWWQPRDKPDYELRCHVQLSGWFLPQAAALWPADRWSAGLSSDTELAEGEWALAPAPRPPARPVAPAGPLDLVRARAELEAVFGFEEFLPLQAEVIENVLQRQDSLAIMPTGSGKSLCYQLPALLFGGLTVVVSPLISLMQDQVDHLRQLEIPAVFLNSSLTYAQYLETARRVRQGRVKLLYVAPETLLRPETLLLLEQCQVDCLTIDEAHCISSWGHDFRPVYRELVAVRRRLPGAVCLALTATATPRVRRDIKESLAIEGAHEFLASFNRENLYLEVRPKQSALRQLLAFLDDHRNQAGIIYCATRKQVDTVTAALAAEGWPALPYHAGLDDLERRRHQRQFALNDNQIVVATVAFGMGIDKSNVRFVVHYDLPQDVESYYQQIGRAGRDGLRADCLLLYSYGDVQTVQFFINQKDPAERRGAQARLQAMVDYAESAACRRRPLLAYFDEAYIAPTCGMCDYCLGAAGDERVDLTVAAQKFLSCVKRSGELFGAGHIADVLRGSRAQKVLQNHHDQLSTYGIGREYGRKQWLALAHQFVSLGLLTRGRHGGLRLAPAAYDVFKGELVLGVAPEPERAPAAAPADDLEYNRALFELLRQKRLELAQAAGVPPYVIFSDRSLVEMAAYYPQSRDAFATMTGVGQAKLERYADHFLPLIGDYCQARQIEAILKPGRRPRPPQPAGELSPRTVELAGAYRAGQSIEAIAAEAGIHRRTVVSHLLKYLQAGRSLPAAGFHQMSQLPPAAQEQVLAAFAEHGADLLRPVYEALGERVSFDELALLRLAYLSSDETGGAPGA